MKRAILTIVLWLIPIVALAGLSGGQTASSGAAITPSSVAATGAISAGTTLTAGTTIIAGSGPTTITDATGLIAAAALGNQSSVANFYRSWHAGSSNAVVSNSAANFIPFDGVAAAQATNEGDVSTVSANTGTVKNLKCVLTTAAGVVTVAGGTNYVVALDKNLSASALTCTIATAASSCTDTNALHAVSVAAGDQLDYLVTPSGTPTALVVKCSAETDI